MDYLLVCGSTVLLAGDFACSKLYQAREGTALPAGLKYNIFNGLFTAVIFLVISGFQVEFSAYSLVMALAMTICSTTYSILGFRVLKSGSMAVYSIFLMSGGMLLPYIYGLCFLEETVNVFRILGIALLLVAVVLSNGTSKAISRKQLILCFAVFFLNGGVSILSKCHQVSSRPHVDTTAFVLYAALARIVLSAAVLPFSHKETNLGFSRKSTPLLIAVAAAISGISYFMQLVGATALPATVLYPLITGGSILFSTLAGCIFFRERLSRLQIISIALCILGTLLFL